jgi:acetyl-CoA carboxylase biotin carboxylase subunit
MPRPFRKVLIANRGEIAVRIIRTLREMGISPVVVYSEADRKALFVRLADEAYLIGPPPSVESYLRVDRILEVARKARVDAIHPGYGFLSEKEEFARSVESAGFVFIGPPPQAIQAMGDKTYARRTMMRCGVPVVPGTEEPVKTLEEAMAVVEKIGFPVMIKAAMGGGGKGMRRVERKEDFSSSFISARREAQSAFGDDQVYIEKYIENPRHIEVQVMGDQHGEVIHLFERECSIQRRHQKIIEESPSPFLTPETRRRITEAGVQAARAVGYYNAGTVEFIVDRNQNFYFLEMNTRIQVEHPVTELVTGLDLIKLQILVAMGERLPLRQNDIEQRGSAIEARIYAEDPDQNFLPSPGRIEVLELPQGPYVRNDVGVYEGSTIPMEYDPMIGKLIVWGRDREDALKRMVRALKEYRVVGVKTNLRFLRALFQHPQVVAGEFDTGFLDRLNFSELLSKKSDPVWAQALAVLVKTQNSFSSPSSEPGSSSFSSPWKALSRRMGMRIFGR